jgi:hypothetical protein
MAIEIKKEDLIKTYLEDGIKATLLKFEFNNTTVMYKMLKLAGHTCRKYRPRKEYRLVD